MWAYWRGLVVLLLIAQGGYDLALGGWFWLLQESILQRQHIIARDRLHALYCRCAHCPDMAKCCCIPSDQVSRQPVVRQCAPVHDGKIPDTWNSRVVATASSQIPLLYAEEFPSVYHLCTTLLPSGIEHPPRV